MSDTFEIHSAVAPIYDEWEDLAREVLSHPFVRPGWVSAWQSSFDSGKLEIHILRRERRVVALAPFIRGRRSLLSSTNWHTPYYEVLARDNDAAIGILRESIARMPARLRIRFASAGGVTSAAVAAVAAELGITPFERHMARAPVILLDGDFETYRRGLSKNLRKNLTRRRARIEDLGEVEMTVTTGGPELENDLETAFALEASGWKGKKGTAMASESRTRRFYTDVARWAADAGILRLVSLKVGGTPIAFDLGLQSNGTYYSLKTGYDVEHHRLGLGAELTYDLIRRCYEEGLQSIALLGSEDEFKRKWSGGEGVDLVEIQAFKGPFAPLDRLVQVHGRALARRCIERVKR